MGATSCPVYVLVYVQSYGFVGTVLGMGIKEDGPVLLKVTFQMVLERGDDVPTLQPSLGVSDLDTAVAFDQFTVLDTPERLIRRKCIAPRARYMHELQEVVPEGHLWQGHAGEGGLKGITFGRV